MEKIGCEIHGFDPSGQNWRNGMHGRDYSNINYAKQYPSANKHFHNWGLGSTLDPAVYPPGAIPQVGIHMNVYGYQRLLWAAFRKYARSTV
jgi:hypothetical protein